MSKIINGMTRVCTNGQPPDPTCVNAQCQSSGFGFCASEPPVTRLSEIKRSISELYGDA